MKHKEKEINISHVNIENMGGRDQSQVKVKFKKFEKSKSIPKTIPKSHNNDSLRRTASRVQHTATIYSLSGLKFTVDSKFRIGDPVIP